MTCWHRWMSRRGRRPGTSNYRPTVMPTTAQIDPERLSRLIPLRRGLNRVDRRIRLLGSARGLGLTLVVLAAVAALGMALDFARPLSPIVRWGLWGTWLVLGLGVLLVKA